MVAAKFELQINLIVDVEATSLKIIYRLWIFE